jgi:hypothetical protein
MEGKGIFVYRRAPTYICTEVRLGFLPVSVASARLPERVSYFYGVVAEWSGSLNSWVNRSELTMLRNGVYAGSSPANATKDLKGTQSELNFGFSGSLVQVNSVLDEGKPHGQEFVFDGGFFFCFLFSKVLTRSFFLSFL